MADDTPLARARADRKETDHGPSPLRDLAMLWASTVGSAPLTAPATAETGVVCGTCTHALFPPGRFCVACGAPNLGAILPFPVPNIR